MPQMQFPFFPEVVTHITPLPAFSKQDGRVTYFNGSMPVFIHDAGETGETPTEKMIAHYSQYRKTTPHPS